MERSKIGLEAINEINSFVHFFILPCIHQANNIMTD